LIPAAMCQRYRQWQCCVCCTPPQLGPVGSHKHVDRRRPTASVYSLVPTHLALCNAPHEADEACQSCRRGRASC
jgi:hypothetical protein